MPHALHWRLSVNLHIGRNARIATLDFARRERIDLQLIQLLFKQSNADARTLFEFSNEAGELLAFQAVAFESYSVTAIDGP